MLHFYISWKQHKNSGFLMFAEAMKVEHWLKMVYYEYSTERL